MMITKLIKELEHYLQSLKVTQGYRVGKTLELFAWQRRFLRGVFRTESGDAALSVARGAGKTTLIAGLGAACLTGPLVQDRGEIVIVGPSLNQARISFKHVQAFLRADIQDTKRFRVWDSSHHSLIEDKMTGAVLKCIGSDPKHAHGLAPAFLVLDEGAQWPRNSSEEMYSTLKTSLGKVDGSRLIALGTKPLEGALHWFNDLLREADYSQVHAAGKDDPLFNRKTWEKANPSIRNGGMPSLLKQYQDEAKRAKRNPGMLASFKALRLNLGTSAVNQNHVISAEEWEQAHADVERAGGYVLGLDLSDGSAMCGASGYWPASGRLESFAAFPAIPSLQERGLRDGVGRLYIQCHELGELIVTDGRAVNIGGLLRKALHDWGRPTAIVCDRYREKDLRGVLDSVQFPQASLVLRGQGFKDGAEDVRMFRRAMFEGRVKPAQSLLLSSAFGEAVTVSDPSGNEKLAKNTEGGRRKRTKDDAAAAAILAVAEGVRRGPSMAAPQQLRTAICGIPGR